MNGFYAAGGNDQAKVTYSLYTALQIHPTASRDELKRAYRRLALQYHPDKSSADVDRFRTARQAYEFLSDTTRRKFYDRFGDVGYEFVEHGGPNSQPFVNTDTFMGRYMLSVLTRPVKLQPFFLFLGLINVMAIMWPIMVDWKLDEARIQSWPWWAVWLPAWIVDGFILSLLALGLVVAFQTFPYAVQAFEDELEGESVRLKMFLPKMLAVQRVFDMAYYVLLFVALIVAQVTLVIKLGGNKDVTGSWGEILRPVQMCIALGLVTKLLLALLVMARGQLAQHLWQHRAMKVLQTIRGPLAGFLFVYCLVGWLDTTDRSRIVLFAIFSIQYASLAIRVLLDCTMERWKMEQAIQNARAKRPDTAVAEEARLRNVYKSMCVAVVLVVAFVFGSLLLVNCHLAGWWPRSWTMTLFPTLSMVALSAFMFGFCLPCVVMCMDLALPLNHFADHEEASVASSNGRGRVPNNSTVIDIGLVGLYPFGYGLAHYQPRIAQTAHFKRNETGR